MRFWKMKALSYLSGIYVYRWYGLAVAWVFCLIGWSAIAVVPDQYKADAKVYIDTQSIMDPLLKGLTVSLDPQQEIAVMLKTLITRPTVEQVIRLTEPNANGLTAPQLEQEVQRLQSNISITQLETKNYYEISYEDKDGTTATGVAQALLSILENNKIGNTRLNMDDARSFINKQIADYENRLREADKRREDFKTANLDILGKANAGNRIDVADGIHDQTLKEYNSAVARRDSVRAQLENTPKTVAADSRIFLGPTITGPVLTGSTGAPPAANVQQRLQQAETLLDELRSKYTENHPDVVSTKKLIAQLQAEISGKPKDPEAPPVMIPNPAYVQLQAKLADEEADVAVQRQKLDAATRDLATARGDASHAIATLTKYNELDRDYGNVEATYKQLLQSRESAALSQAKEDQNEGISFRVLEPPQKPQFPAAPNRLILNSVVLLIGIGSGMAAAILLMLNASRLITTEDIAVLFTIPVLGVVTRVRELGAVRNRLATISAAACALLLLVAYGGVMTFLQTSVHSVSYGAIVASLKGSIHYVLGALNV